jgi:hypothetical protein
MLMILNPEFLNLSGWKDGGNSSMIWKNIFAQVRIMQSIVTVALTKRMQLACTEKKFLFGKVLINTVSFTDLDCC